MMYAGIYALCAAPACTATTIAAATLDECAASCTAAGWDACRSFTWGTNGACTQHSERVEDLGPHGSVQVLAGGGLGKVTGSACEPPAAVADYPTAETTRFGVDWSAACVDGAAFAVVPDQQPSCGSECSIVPASRQDRYIGPENTSYTCAADCVCARVPARLR